MSLHEGMATRRVTSSDIAIAKKIMDTCLGHAQLLCTRGAAAWKSVRLNALLLRRASLGRHLGLCNRRSYVTFEILSLRAAAESWSLAVIVVARQTSDLFDKESF